MLVSIQRYGPLHRRRSIATRSPSQRPEEIYALQIRAEVLRTLSRANEGRRGHSDRLLLGSGDDPVERSVDTVAGSETVTIAGDLSETIEGSRSNSSSRQDFNIDGKLTLRGREETNILHGNMREMHHGQELLLSGMSDDMVGGLGIRTTAPVDLWLSALTGIEEKLGTAAADGALVEIAGMHMEREYGKGVHAYGAGVWTGAFYTHTATGFRPLLKMVRGVRNMTPGGGGGGGGSAAAAPPPAGAPPVATMPPTKFLKGVGKLGTNATPGDLIRLADLGEDARELQEVENARQIPGADVLKRVDDVAPDGARGVILLDDGTGKLAAHAADGADFDDPDWMRHLGGDAPPADDAARGADLPNDFGNPSLLRAEVDRIRLADLAPLLDPTTNADEVAQSISDRILALQRTAGTSQEKIRQYSLALELVKEGRNPVGALDDIDTASNVRSMLRFATPMPPPPGFADEIRPVTVAPLDGRRPSLYSDPRRGVDLTVRPIDETRVAPPNVQRFTIEEPGVPGIPIVKIHTSFQEGLENGTIVADVRTSYGERLQFGSYFIQYETGAHPSPAQLGLTEATPTQIPLTQAELADIREGVDARARAGAGADAANDTARATDAPAPGTPDDPAPTPAQVPNDADSPQVREYLDPDDQGQDRLSRLAAVERIKRDKLATALNPETNVGEAAQRIADRIRTLEYAADTSPETIRQYNLALALVQEGAGLHPAGVLDDLDVAADVTDMIRFSTPIGSDPAFLAEISNIRVNNLASALPDGVDADRAARMIADRLQAIEDTLDTARLSPQEVFDLKLDYHRALALVEAGLDPTGIINNAGISTEVDGILRSTMPIPVDPSPVYAEVGNPRKGPWAGAEAKPADYTRRPEHKSIGVLIADAQEARWGLETTEGGLPIAYVHPDTFEAVQAADELEDFRVIPDVRDKSGRRYAEGEYILRPLPLEPEYRQVPVSEAEKAELAEFARNRYRPRGADNTGEAFEPWADLINRREQADRFYQHKPETTGAKPSGLQLMGENHLQTTRIELRNILADLVGPYADDLGLDDARLTAMDTNMRGSDTALDLRREFVRAISEARAEGQIENSRMMQSTLDNWDALATAQIAKAIDHADELADWDGIRLADNLDQGAFIDELRRLQAEEVAKYPEDVGTIPVEEVNAINAAVTAYGRAIGNAEMGYDPVPYILETEDWAKTFGGDGGLDRATAVRVSTEVRRNIVEALDNPAFKTAPDVAPTDPRAILTQAQTDAFHAGDFDRAWDLQRQIDQFDARQRAGVDSDYANPADLIVRPDAPPQPSRGELAARREALAGRDPGTWPQSFNPNGADTSAVDDLPSAAPADLFDEPTYILPPAAKRDLFDTQIYASVELSRNAEVPNAAPARIRTTGADEIYSRVWTEPRVPTNSEGRFKVDTGSRRQIRYDFYGDVFNAQDAASPRRTQLTDMQRKLQRWFGTDSIEDAGDTRRTGQPGTPADSGAANGRGAATDPDAAADPGLVVDYIETDDYSAINLSESIDLDDDLVPGAATKPAADGSGPRVDIYRWEPPEGGQAGNQPRLNDDGASWSPDDAASAPDSPRAGEDAAQRPTNADSSYETSAGEGSGNGPGPSQLPEDAEGEYGPLFQTDPDADFRASDYTRETLVTTTPVQIGNGADGLPRATDDGRPIAYISPNVLEVMERQGTVLEVFDEAGNKLEAGEYVVRVDQSLARREFATPQVTMTAAEMDAIAEGVASRRQRALTQWAATGGLLEDASARPVEVSELTRSMPSPPGSSVDIAPPPARTDWTRMPLPGEEGFGESSGRFLGAGAGEADRTSLHRLDIANPAGELSPRSSMIDRQYESMYELRFGRANDVDEHGYTRTDAFGFGRYSSANDIDESGYTTTDALGFGRYSSANDIDEAGYTTTEELLRVTAAIEPEGGGRRVPLPFDESVYEILPGAEVVPAAEDPSIRMVQSLNDVRRPFEPTNGAAVDETLGRWMDEAAAAGGSDVRRADADDTPHRFAETFPAPARQPAPPPLPDRAPRQRTRVNPARKPIDLPFEEQPFNLRGEDTLPQRVAERIWQQGSYNSFNSFVLRNQLEDLIEQGRLSRLPLDDADRLAQRIGEKINSLWITDGNKWTDVDPYFRALVLAQEGVDPTNFTSNPAVRADIARWMQRPPALPPEVDATRLAQRIADKIENLKHTSGTTPEKFRQYNLALSLVQQGLDPRHVITDLDAQSDMRIFLRPTPIRPEDLARIPEAERPLRMPRIQNDPDFIDSIDEIQRQRQPPPLPDIMDQDLAVRWIADRITAIESSFGATRRPPQEMHAALQAHRMQLQVYNRALALVDRGLNPVGTIDDAAIASEINDILRSTTSVEPPYASIQRQGHGARPFAKPEEADYTRPIPVNTKDGYVAGAEEADAGLPVTDGATPIVYLEPDTYEALSKGNIVLRVRDEGWKTLGEGEFVVRVDPRPPDDVQPVEMSEAELAELLEAAARRRRRGSQ